MKKIGRNDPCWCGSGLKFKKCHLNREHETPITKQKIIKRTVNAFSKRMCLHPDASKNKCSEKIIKAHTVQLGSGLRKIAQDGHVYTLRVPINERIKNESNQLEPLWIGINDASTFTGFCEFHDDSTFALIEKSKFHLNIQNCFLLSYRAMCLEYYNKLCMLDLIKFNKSLDKGAPTKVQVNLQSYYTSLEMGYLKSYQDLSIIKAQYDSALIHSNFNHVKYYAILLKNTPEILSSGCGQPEIDFQGRILQDLSETRKMLDFITFTLLPIEMGGIILFGWLGKKHASEKLIDSLRFIPDNKLPNAIVRYIIGFFENAYINPLWFDSLGKFEKDEFIYRLNNSLPMDSKSTSCLIDDGVKYVDWVIKDRMSNF
ncbi:MAG: SEC-C domain-containing protein [candidate division Zixibacteria bacterium]|nr:SEC-C domain-containing protein [candidate division Zixibacteria bacterium]